MLIWFQINGAKIQHFFGFGKIKLEFIKKIEPNVFQLDYV